MWHKGYAAYDTLEICMPSKLNLSIFPGFSFLKCVHAARRVGTSAYTSRRRVAYLTRRTLHISIPGSPCAWEDLWSADFSCIRLLRKAASLPLSHAYLLRVIDMLLLYSYLFLSSSTLSFYALVGHKNPIDSTRVAYLGPIGSCEKCKRFEFAQAQAGRQSIDRFLVILCYDGKKDPLNAAYLKSQHDGVCVCGRIPVKHGMTLLFVCLQEWISILCGQQRFMGLNLVLAVGKSLATMFDQQLICSQLTRPK